MQMVIRILVGLMALLFLFMAMGFVFNPVQSSGSVGLEAMDLTGMSTLRGDVGGLFLGCAVMLILGLVRGQTLWFLAVAILMGTIALGRVFGFLLDGTSSTAVTNFVAELVFIAVLTMAHRRLGRT